MEVRSENWKPALEYGTFVGSIVVGELIRKLLNRGYHLCVYQNFLSSVWQPR